MSTVSVNAITAEEFFQWVNQPGNRDRRFELHEGEVLEMPPAGKYHGFVCGNVAGILRNFSILRRNGYVCTNDSGVIVGRDPDSVRGPDVTFYEDDETADDMSRQYAEVPPLLAVEVISPSDRFNSIMLRVTQLLNRGVKVVWVVDPEMRDVSLCQAGQEPRLVSGNESLSGGTALPDFECAVSELFAIPRK